MDGHITIGAKLDTKDFTRQIAEVESKLNDLESSLTMAREDDSLFDKQDVQEMEVEVEKLKNKLIGLYKQQDAVNQQGFSKTSFDLGDIGNKISHISKSIIRWGIALLGVRSAMTLIRGSLSILSQYDDQLSTNVEYIRYVIAMMLKPVIEYIVDLVFKILQYVNYIAQAWFGVNLFAKASAKSFTQTNKALAKSTKEAKKLNKELLSFDKINKLNKDKSNDSGGGTKLPTTDLSKVMDDRDAPEWLKWIVENKDAILSTLAGIVLYLGLMKFGIDPVTALLLASAVMVLVEAFKDLDKWYDEVVEDGYKVENHFKQMGKTLGEFGIAITLVGAAIGSVIVFATGLEITLYGVIFAILGYINKAITTVRKTWDGLMTWFDKNLDIFGNVIWGYVDSFLGIFEGLFGGIWRGAGEVYSGILLCLKGDWKNGLKTALKGIGNMIIGIINTLLSAIEIMFAPVRAVIVELAKIKGENISMKDVKFPRIPYLAKGGIISYPGKGVPIGTNAIAGERGQEGVLPLTDNQAMETLGESIGKHVKVNLDLTTEIEGRVLARVLKQINNEDSFARNGV